MKHSKILKLLFFICVNISCINIAIANTDESLSKLQSAYDSGNLKEAEVLSFEILEELYKRDKNVELDQDDNSMNKVLITVVLNKLNGIYKKSNDLDKALKHITEAYSIAKKESDFPTGMLSMYTYNLANTYKLLKDLDEARSYYEEALDMSLKLLKSEDEEERGYAQFILPNSTEQLIEVYHDLGMKEKIPELHKRVDEALLDAPL